jgi:hypothetical protein
MESTPSNRRRWGLAGRVLLGLVVGASFGIAIGALVASWVFGVEAIESEAVRASYLAAAITIFGALVGAVIGYRTGLTADANGASAD